MAYSRRKRSKPLIISGLLVISSLLLSLSPRPIDANIVFYDPDIDIAMGMFDYVGESDESIDRIYPGIYIGGYFSLKSPIFSNYFKKTQIYNIFEAGLTQNEIETVPDVGGDGAIINLVTIPLHIDFAYKLPVTERLFLSPFLGTGIHITYTEFFTDSFHVSPVIQTGLELKYLIRKSTSLKVKLDYGYVFDTRVERGSIRYFKLRFPVPFIP